VIRLGTEGTATAYLASDKGTAIPPIPYEDLPEALANGKGRIRPGPQQKAHVASFLRNALGTGDSGSQDTHDRVVFVRSASFRQSGWDWLQDKHVRADRLILPGIEIKDDEELPRTLTPQDCPGLRIIRIRERGPKDDRRSLSRACGSRSASVRARPGEESSPDAPAGMATRTPAMLSRRSSSRRCISSVGSHGLLRECSGRVRPGLAGQAARSLQTRD
jgi:hypothetical protein